MPAGEFPGLGVLPADVDRVVEVEQQTFAAVEEAEADDVVVGERCQRVEDDVPDEAEGVAAGLAAGNGESRHLVAVAVHMLEVERQGGVSVME